MSGVRYRLSIWYLTGAVREDRVGRIVAMFAFKLLGHDGRDAAYISENHGVCNLRRLDEIVIQCLPKTKLTLTTARRVMASLKAEMTTQRPQDEAFALQSRSVLDQTTSTST